MFTAIWAQDKNGLIGRKNQLPWRLPNDLRFFKEQTLHKTLVMGRLTFEGMGAKPLPNRKTIVLSKDRTLQKKYPDILVLASVQEVIEYAKKTEEEVIIAGGSSIYQLFEPYIATIFRTEIDEKFEGDTYFPEWKWEDFSLVSETKGMTDEKNRYPHTFQEFKRNFKEKKE